MPGATSRSGGGDDFSGKVVLVTGAASGLGRSIAVAFARAGSDIVIADINEVGLRETAAMVEAAGSRCLARRVDVSSRAEMEAFASEVLREWGRVDILVNNAGVGVGGELKDIPIDDFEWIVGINLMGEVYGTRLFLPRMVERQAGHIVNISSLSGLVLLPLHIPYTTTKFGVTGFSHALWAETRRHGVGVTLVCPGAVRTNIMAGTRVASDACWRVDVGDALSRLLEKIGADPEEVAERILKAVEKRRFLLLIGPESYVLYYLWRISPGLVRRIAALLTRLFTGG